MSSFLLQQPPFCFVKSLEEWDKQGGITTLKVESGLFFVRNDELMAAGIIEHMAQSCAAWIGQITLEKGEEVHIMPLCAVKKLYIYKYPKVGDCLRTLVHKIDLDFGIYLMEVNVYNNGELIASAEVKVGA